MTRITPATALDIPVLRDLAHRIWHEHYPDILSRQQIDYMLARMYDTRVMQLEMAEGIFWHLVHLEHEPVGFISCAIDAAAAHAKLHKLYLLPALHGRGIGRQMLDWVKAFAADRHAHEIRLQVNKRNTRAIRAYERAGFRVRENVLTEIGEGFVMDDFIMILPLERTGG